MVALCSPIRYRRLREVDADKQAVERHNSVDEEKLKGNKLFRRLRELVAG